mmetsp:Transcript_22210/g.71758  ORF Transcript_22210/g.71758 Transcript_22210/m.71758 type:complete len:239 (-) Transcript_22210:840-1556(-)
MDSAAASSTIRKASATQKAARNTSSTAPEALVTASSAVSGEASVSAAAAVQSAAIDSFASVSSRRSPAVSSETVPMLLIVSSKACRAPSVKLTSCTATSTYALCEMYCRYRVDVSRQQRRQQCAIPRSSGLSLPSVCAWCRQCSRKKRKKRPGMMSSEPMARDPAEYRNVRPTVAQSRPSPPPPATPPSACAAPKYHRTISPAVAQNPRCSTTSTVQRTPRVCSQMNQRRVSSYLSTP